MNERHYWNDAEIVQKITHFLQNSVLVAGSSDTVPGLLAPVTQEGFELLNQIKGRQDKPYLVLVGSIKQALSFSDLLKKEPFNTLIHKLWPGPLTLIVPAKNSVPSCAVSATGAVALRVPDHAGLQQVAHALHGVFSTSANKAGQPVPSSVDMIDQTIKDHSALIVDDQIASKKFPSTILDCTGDTIQVVREGAYRKDMLSTYLPNMSS